MTAGGRLIYEDRPSPDLFLFTLPLIGMVVVAAALYTVEFFPIALVGLTAAISAAVWLSNARVRYRVTDSSLHLEALLSRQRCSLDAVEAVIREDPPLPGITTIYFHAARPRGKGWVFGARVLGNGRRAAYVKTTEFGVWITPSDPEAFIAALDEQRRATDGP